MGGYADSMHLTQKISLSVIHDSVCLTQGVILALHVLGNTFLLLYTISIESIIFNSSYQVPFVD